MQKVNIGGTDVAQQWNVGILLFNEVEVLDFAGPFEVFSITTLPTTHTPSTTIIIDIKRG